VRTFTGCVMVTEPHTSASPAAAARVIVVMGVSGAGKTTVGQLLAERLGWHFADADDHHPPENVRKMAAGIPLNDEDRIPWLERLHGLTRQHLRAGQSLVLACSALKSSYRDVLAADDARIGFVYLYGSFELIYSRLEERSDHYMPKELLRSQFEALEPPGGTLSLEVSPPAEELVEEIISRLELQPAG